MLAFPHTYQQLCAKLNDSEIFVATFGRHRAITVRTFLTLLKMAVIQFTAASKHE
jgi:hypothetical protein